MEVFSKVFEAYMQTYKTWFSWNSENMRVSSSLKRHIIDLHLLGRTIAVHRTKRDFPSHLKKNYIHLLLYMNFTKLIIPL